MKLILRQSLAGFVFVAILTHAAYADANRPLPNGRQAAEIAKTYQRIAAGWWQYFLGIPVAQHPALQPDGPVDCGINQRGPLQYIPSTGPNFPDFNPRFYSCTIDRRAIAFPLITRFVANFNDPFDLGSLENKRQFLSEGDDFWCRLSASVDGEPTNIRAPSVLIQSSPFLYESGVNGEPDYFGVPAGEVTDPEAVAGGYFVFLAPLSRGQHTLNITGGVCDPDTGELFVFLDNTYDLNVVNRRRDGQDDDDE